MFLDNLSIYELIMINGIILLFLGFFAFSWFFNKLREVSKGISGYLMFVQLTFIFTSCGIFLAIFLYYIIFDRHSQVDIFAVFLTVIVGFMGTIMGIFFSEKTVGTMIKYSQEREKAEKIEKYGAYRKLSKILERLKIE